MGQYNCDVLTMPDKWEYPWYAAWDLAFHTIPLALVDPVKCPNKNQAHPRCSCVCVSHLDEACVQEWAKRQIILVLREWYMAPSGQLPAYEWNYSDVNPPVHAWAAMRVFQITRK